MCKCRLAMDITPLFCNEAEHRQQSQGQSAQHDGRVLFEPYEPFIRSLQKILKYPL
jgi:hypothetical protein